MAVSENAKRTKCREEGRREERTWSAGAAMAEAAKVTRPVREEAIFILTSSLGCDEERKREAEAADQAALKSPTRPCGKSAARLNVHRFAYDSVTENGRVLAG